jgi:Tfp pilus assembly protein PilF
MQAYYAVLRSDDNRADAYHRLALLHDRRGESEQARRLYFAALERDPNNANLQCDYGYSLYLQGRWEEAESSLRRALAMDPQLARAHANLGMVLARSGRQDEALHEFQMAGCREAEARNNLAFALLLERRREAALQQLEMALALDPELKQAQRSINGLRAMSVGGDLAQGEPRPAQRIPQRVQAARHDQHASWVAHSAPQDGSLSPTPE